MSNAQDLELSMRFGPTQDIVRLRIARQPKALATTADRHDAVVYWISVFTRSRQVLLLLHEAIVRRVISLEEGHAAVWRQLRLAAAEIDDQVSASAIQYESGERTPVVTRTLFSMEASTLLQSLRAKLLTVEDESHLIERQWRDVRYGVSAPTTTKVTNAVEKISHLNTQLREQTINLGNLTLRLQHLINNMNVV